MLKLTLQEAVKHHRAMWHGIAEEMKNGCGEHIINLKDRVKEKLFPELHDAWIDSGCFLCHYDSYCRDISGRIEYFECKYCPCYNKNPNRDWCLGGLYYDFKDALESEEYEEAYELALTIAELPIVNWKGEKITG